MTNKKVILTLIFLFFQTLNYAQNNFDAVKIETEKLTSNIYMLTGRGGNIGLSIGHDGVLIIDSQFAPLTPKIIDAIKAISDKPISFLANTHHHGDHTGGNENLAKKDALIIAHDNVHKRISENKKRSKEALPIITFNDKLNLYINGEQVLMFHTDNAHTDGDALVYFTESNVLHTGDTYFNGRYPYIDLNSNGSISGYINAVETGLMLVDEDTKIIPGHGNLSNKAEYQSFLNMLRSLKSKVYDEIENGKSEDEVAKNKNITKMYDDQDYDCCFISSEKMRRTLYKSLKD